MSLRKQSGNMYSFVSHTWNPIKGKCYHDCSYCYMKRFKQSNVRLDEKELKTDLGKGNFIFVGSGTDIFAQDIEKEWINKVLDYCSMFENKYLFQTKNPERFMDYQDENTGIIDKSVLCTTIESNRFYPLIMGNSPKPLDRAMAMHNISYSTETYITIEPIMDFDLSDMVSMIKYCNPSQVNIGADSGNNKLPEPNVEEVLALISEIAKFTKVNLKSNLKRIVGDI